ncbi:peptidoglycan-binding LysM domain-containing protein [Raphanus sativus]|nr:peptidoglycan-binding LysM domain-containing protein [Raphanus sativus]
MDRERRLSNRNGTPPPPEYSNGKFRDDNCYGGFLDRSENSREKSPSRSKILRIPSPNSSPPPSSSSPTFPGSNSPDRGYIEHRVSKFDTLAGIAIKYGVEVADVKKMNGLVTDLQMFALKSLQIPLPGRHPPSPCLSNGSLHHGEGCSCHELEPPNDNNDVFDSFQSLRLKSSEKKVSPAMYSLQGYYGLKPANRTVSEGGFLEMGTYKTETSHHHLSSNGGSNQYLRPFPSTSTPLNHHRKSRSLANALFDEVNQSPDSNNTGQETSSDKFMRRRQKSEADFSSRTPELLLKEENSSSNGGFLSIAGKGLALRSKASSRTNLSAESETSSFNPVPINLMDAPVSDSFGSVRKSSSASSLQDPEGNSSSNGSSSLSLWPTSKWSLKPDLLTPAAITSSIFDGLPKPLTGRKSKTAMD